MGQLNAATPTPFDSTNLKKQLANIGLDCAQLSHQNLSGYIDQVNAELADGKVQSMAIKAPQGDVANPMLGENRIVAATSLAAQAQPMVSAATGNWTINDEAEGYAPNLEIIQYPTHFQWLYDNRATNGFAGVIDNPPTIAKNEDNAAAIQKLFVSVGLTASATLVKGLDKSTMQATLTNVIQPLSNANLSNYNVTDSRAIFLVDNYDPKTQHADGIGVLFIKWHLIITDYKRKDKDGGDTHPTTLTINAGAVMYSDPSVLCTDYNAVLKQFAIDPTTAPTCRV
ncbi:hypothetical protein Salmuc_03080 [Salipiger mucosus DSM 16094]|uniref:Uncharacterized protein n=1 Tax=Salipiger mucosus DSM 16094 TaxID=1123237 RepID=S9QRM5_9RHOB|nr:hypothetical protein Salmuc_03080 [Salipiger mucosus DSM 16094]